jgi:beta-xylosidase
MIGSADKTMDKHPDSLSRPSEVSPACRMNRLILFLLGALVLASAASRPLAAEQAHPAHNPLIWADVPDMSMMRVGKTYYMSSTTMHLSPGVPIMKSKDLVNWDLVGYAYNRLVDNDAMNLENGQNAYGKGSWASSLRFHDGLFYASTFSATTGRTHIYTTRDPERGPWKATSFAPALGDHSLFFDDDGRVYMVHGSGRIMLTEMQPDLSGIKPGGVNKVIVENVNALFGTDQGGLKGEGSQLFKIKGRYYLFNIASPGSRWARTVIISRADAIDGPYESRIALDDRGIAQGGLIDTPQGKWYAYLFKDNGAVGRIPYLVPVTWKDGWPVLGENGKVPMTLDIPAGGQGVSGVSGIVASDEFNRRPGDPKLPLAWQWNHNPDNAHWDILQKPGRLRITTGRVDQDVLGARNTLTQRTFGPTSSASTRLKVDKMKNGDVAGLIALQKKYGYVGVEMDHGQKSIVMVNAHGDSPKEIAAVPLMQKVVYFMIDCDFRKQTDKANFYYSLDGKTWKPIGNTLQMVYTVPQFMGYRFGLFNYATEKPGGYVDFDYYRIGPGGGSSGPSSARSAVAPVTRATLPPLAPRARITSDQLAPKSVMAARAFPARPLKPRIVVLTDISPNDVEPDDTESMIRLLVHADQFEIEALVATTGWSNSGGLERPDIIHELINAYEKDLPNLLKRSAQQGFLLDESRQHIGYWPSPRYLRERTMLGSKTLGRAFIGEANRSPGSDFIVRLADEKDDRPLWVAVWGSGNTLAQAIWQVQQTRSPAELKAFLHKLRVYTISDQDAAQKIGNTIHYPESSHQWMRREFADDLLFLWDECAWKFQNHAGILHWPEYEALIQNHSNLGSLYPKYKWGVEGDTPSFLYLMPVGLSDPEIPGQGGWGGFFERGQGPDNATVAWVNQQGSANATCTKYQKQFYPATFNDFAARMAWAQDGKGNRNPIVAIKDDRSLAILTNTSAAGTTVTLNASKSTDPDGDKLSFKWWILPEAGTYRSKITLANADTNTATLIIPSDAAGKSFDVICEVTDDGTPSLTSYRRIIFRPPAR